MVIILGLVACISSGISCALYSLRVVKLGAQRRYVLRAKEFTHITHRSTNRPQYSFFEVLSRLLESTLLGRACASVTSLQTRMRELCGLKTSVFELEGHGFNEQEQKCISGLFSAACALCVGVLVQVATRNTALTCLAAAISIWLIPSWFGGRSQRLALQKRNEYERALPEMLSVIVLAVQAGATFDTAFEAYVTRFTSALAQQSKEAYELYISQVVSRNDALDGLAREVDSELFYHFVATVKRALYLGSPLGIALENQLRDIREYREEKIKEEIAKKPVQILLPLGVFILPGMLILLLGPILMEVMQGISMR